MGHLLDTDVVIDFLKGDLPTERLIDPLVQAGIALSMITYMEIYQGIVESPDSAALEVEFEAFLKTVKLLPLSTDVRAVAPGCGRTSNSKASAFVRVRSTSSPPRQHLSTDLLSSPATEPTTTMFPVSHSFSVAPASPALRHSDRATLPPLTPPFVAPKREGAGVSGSHCRSCRIDRAGPMAAVRAERQGGGAGA